MNKIAKQDALGRLVEELPIVYPKMEAQKILWGLLSFTKKVDAFELIYNDDSLNEVPEAVHMFFNPSSNNH